MICVPNFNSLGWFLFLSAVNSCWQIFTANDSCHKQNLNGIIIYPLKLIPVPNFSSLGWFSFLSAVNSCWQLLTADDSGHKKNLNGIFIYPLKLIPVPNFSSLGWFSFLSAVNSCWQLLTADGSCHKKIVWDFHLPTKADTCAKFQLSRLIFIFISCQQLLTAFDSWWQLSQKKIKWVFHLPPKADTCAKFQLSRLLGGLARECDIQTDRQIDARRQVNIELT